MKRGNCYVASEALYHIMGGKKAGWKPMFMRHVRYPHWFLQHKSGLILDPSVRQFKKDEQPNYTKARGCGFRCDYTAGSFEDCQAVIALLWNWLSPTKRAQAKALLLEQV